MNKRILFITSCDAAVREPNIDGYRGFLVTLRHDDPIEPR